MPTTFDLSTLGLSAGTHFITVKARASGYTDSDESNAVSYTVQGEKTYTLSGTWLFNTSLNAPSKDAIASITFVSNGQLFNGGMGYWINTLALSYQYWSDGRDYQVAVYKNNSWTDEAYRTITFDGEQTVSKEFHDWFTDNATEVYSGTKELTLTCNKVHEGTVAYYKDRMPEYSDSNPINYNGVFTNASPQSVVIEQIKDFVTVTEIRGYSIVVESHSNCLVTDNANEILIHSIEDGARIVLYGRG